MSAPRPSYPPDAPVTLAEAIAEFRRVAWEEPVVYPCMRLLKRGDRLRLVEREG